MRSNDGTRIDEFFSGKSGCYGEEHAHAQEHQGFADGCTMQPLHLRKVGPALEKLEIWGRM